MPESIDVATATTHLQGVGSVPAVPAQELKVGDVITITVGYSEAACYIRAAGRTMQARLHQHMVQLLDTDGGPYSAPITYGEAGIAHIYRELNPDRP